MKLPLGKRRLATFGALAAVVAATLMVVLPALAATSSGFYGHVTAVTPTYVATGGQANDCALFKAQPGGAGVGTDQYLVQSPKSVAGKTQTVTASNGMTVNFTINVDKSGTFLDFSVSGAIVTDIGIKGGNGTDWYNYEGKPGGGVTSDSGLTAPAQSANGSAPYYGLSQTVFCYTPKITCQANTPFGDPSVSGYSIELPSCSGKDGVFYDFAAGTTGAQQPYFNLHTEGATTTTKTPLVEHLTGTSSSSSQIALQYTDIYPFDSSKLHAMRYCKLDPRAGGSDPLALAPAYQSIDAAPSVLQDPLAVVDPESTSCLISMRTWVDTSHVVHFEAYIYTDIDGQRVF